MVTIQEVAKEAGVSVGSVSRYLNGHTLRENNVKKIKEAIEKLNYKENFFAKGLKSSQSRSVGLLLDNMQSNFSATLVAHIYDILEQHGYTIQLVSYRNDPSKIVEKIDYLQSRFVDGIVMVGIEQSWEEIESIRILSIPVISVLTILDLPKVDSVIVNDRISTNTVINKMLDLNYEKIGIITAPQNDYVARERLLGVFDAFEEHAKSFPEDLIFYGDYSKESGTTGMQYLLEKEVTAVFVCNYNMSLGALKVLNNQNVEIGKNIFYASYDYFDTIEIFAPDLTVVKQKVEEIGIVVANRILERIRNNNVLTKKKIIIENDIVWSSSIGKTTENHEVIE